MKRLYIFFSVIVVIFITSFNCETGGSGGSGGGGGGSGGGGGGGGGTSSSTACIHPVDEGILTIRVDFGELTGYYAEYNELCQPSLGALMTSESTMFIEYGFSNFAQISPVIIRYPICFTIFLPSREEDAYNIEDGAVVSYSVEGSEKIFESFRDEDWVTILSNGSSESSEEEYILNYVYGTFEGSLRAAPSSASDDYEYIYIHANFSVRIINP